MEFSLVPAQALPCIDPQRTMLQAYLPRKVADFVQTKCFAGRSRVVIRYSYGVAILHYAITPYLPIAIENSLAWIHLIPLIYYSMTMGEARVDLVHLILQTFEFWFVQASNTILLVAFTIYLGDWRILAAVTTWVGATATLLVDAVQTKSFVEVLIPPMAMTGSMPPVMAILLNQFQSTHDYDVVKISKYTVTIREIVLNCFSTLAIIVFRNTFLYYKARTNRKEREQTSSSQARKEPQEQANITMRIESMSYFSPLRIQTTTTNAQAVVQPQLSSTQVQLHLVQSPLVRPLDANNVMCRSLLPFACHCFVWWLVVSIWISWITQVALFPVVFNYPDATTSTLLAIVVLVTTVGNVLMLIGLCHRDLLWSVATSFDVVLLSVQSTIGHLCVCDFFDWQWRFCVGIFSAWCYLHIVLWSDALVPWLTLHTNHRMLQRMSWCIVLMILVLHLLAQVLLTFELLYGHHWHLQNRLLFSFQVTPTESASMLIVVVFFGRLMTVFPWCLLLLYRHVCRVKSHQLLLLMGSTEYDGQVPVHLIKFNQIVPH